MVQEGGGRVSMRRGLIAVITVLGALATAEGTGRRAEAQTAGDAAPPGAPGGSGVYDVPLVPMEAVPLDRSLARLVADGWRVVGVSLPGRVFVYHLVGEGALALCFLDANVGPPSSECMRLGPAP